MRSLAAGAHHWWTTSRRAVALLLPIAAVTCGAPVEPAGITLQRLERGSVAAVAGLEAGDVLLAWARHDEAGVDGPATPLVAAREVASVLLAELPRHAIVLLGERQGRAARWLLPAGGSWREGAIEVRARPAASADKATTDNAPTDEATSDGPTGSLVEALLAARAHRDHGDLDQAAAALTAALATPANQPTVPQRLVAAALASELAAVELERGGLAAGRRAADTASRVFSELAPRSLDLAEVLTLQARLARRQGETAVAGEAIERAVALAAAAGRESTTWGRALATASGLRRLLGSPAEAASAGRQAAVVLEHLAPRSRDLADALHRQGIIAVDDNRLDEGEQLFRRAAALAQAEWPDGPEMARAFHNLGLIALQRNDADVAQLQLARSARLWRRLAPRSIDLAVNLNALATVKMDLGDYPGAERALHESLAIYRAVSPKHRLIVQTLQNLAMATRDGRGDLVAAETYLREALMLAGEQEPNSLLYATTLSHLGELVARRGDLGRALVIQRQALAMGQRISERDPFLVDLLTNLAETERQSGQLAAWAEHACAAIDILDERFDHLGGTASQQALFASQTNGAYRSCVAALATLGRAEAAFSALERGRARSLLSLLATRRLTNRDLPPAISRERKRLATAYDATQDRLAVLGAGEESTAEALRARLKELWRAQEEISATLRDALPPPTLADSARPLDTSGALAVLDPGTLLLAFSVGRDASWVLALSPGQRPLARRLEIGERELRQRVRELRQGLEDPSADPVALDRQGQELYALLLAPIEPQLASAERLLVSPDGPLHSLPFAVLGPRSAPLVSRLPIHTVLSASVYAQLRQGRGGTTADRRDQLIAFGDPSYRAPRGTAGDAEPVLRLALPLELALQRGLRLTALPGSRREVAAIAQLVPDAKVFFGSEASEARARSVAPQARWLHFACHALLDERLPLNSSLALAQPDRLRPGEDNGLLQAWEIFAGLQLDADLVTLSACNTGLGQEVSGEGLIGLSRAFQYAGARSVLASLWSVSDRATARLMPIFYRRLLAGAAKDEALREAQLAVAADPETRHPFHWAGFELLGDRR